MAVSLGGDGEEGDPVAEINITPLVDVLLCLLIIFMISQPTPSNESIPLSVPKDAIVEGPSDPNATLLVTLDGAGNGKLGSEPLAASYAQIVEQFRNNEKARSDNKIAIKADDKTKYQVVVRIMAAAREAGIAQVGIASERL